MNNYIINDKTIAIRKLDKKTIIYDVENIRVINKNIINILNLNCMFYGSNYVGRKRSAEQILHIKYKAPLIISENPNIIMLTINSIRKNSALFIVVNKIIDYEIDTDDYVKIICCNKQVFKTNLSKYSFEKMIINAVKLNNYLKWHNSVNFV